MKKINDDPITVIVTREEYGVLMQFRERKKKRARFFKILNDAGKEGDGECRIT